MNSKRIIREGGFLFNLCSSLTEIRSDRDQEFFCQFADILVATMVRYLHEVIFTRDTYDLTKKETRKQIIDFIFNNILIKFNNMNIEMFPYRVMIENSAVVEVNHGCGTIITEDKSFQDKIKQSEVIKHLFAAIQKQNIDRFKKSIEKSELLLFDVDMFPKFAPLAIINGKTGASLYTAISSEWISGDSPTATKDTHELSNDNINDILDKWMHKYNDDLSDDDFGDWNDDEDDNDDKPKKKK